MDCDSVLTADDCDDSDPALMAVADDADCDGVLTADDCDDGDSTLIAIADDADCDGVLTADDCDDGDPSTIYDMDCDGVLTADDCDDGDADVYPFAGDAYGDGIDSDCDGLDCEADWHTWSTYFAVCIEIGSLSWADAGAECIDSGYQYASILNADESNKVDDLSMSLGAWSYWLGATDSASDGFWVWTDGSPGGFTNWNTGEPLGDGDCLEFSIGTGWNDIDCGHTQPGGYVCQYRW
jgi:hypothetical protein